MVGIDNQELVNRTFLKPNVKRKNFDEPQTDKEYGNPNYAKYTVKKKNEGLYLLARILFIVGYVAIGVGYILFTSFVLSMPALSAISLLLVWILWFFTFKYVSIEYAYAVADSYIIVAKIYGEKKAKFIMKHKISDMEIIAPYDRHYREQYKLDEITKRYVAVSSMSSPDIYFAVFKDEDGSKALLLFEATNKTLRALKYYNGENTVIRQMRY